MWEVHLLLSSISISCSVMPNSLQPHRQCSLPGSSFHEILQARILEWLPFLVQGIFLSQGSNLSLLLCRQIPYHLSHQGSPLASIRGLQMSNWGGSRMPSFSSKVPWVAFSRVPAAFSAGPPIQVLAVARNDIRWWLMMIIIMILIIVKTMIQIKTNDYT